MRWKVPTKAALVIVVLACALGLSIPYAASASISRPVGGSGTINILPIQASADVDGNGIVDGQDLLAVARKLNTVPAGHAREDVNRDSVIDVIDLAIVARYSGQEVVT